MDGFSNWNIVDLHIHSKESDKVKPNDYEGNDYSAKELLDTLKTYSKNNGMIFSITDHDCINENLYRDISNYIKGKEYQSLNYIIGIELDVFDSTICDKRFHCLTLFETTNIDVILLAIDDLFNKAPVRDRDSKENLPTIRKIFSEFQKHDIQNFIMIPHYNAKSQGIKTKYLTDKVLNSLCFNAFEDANNVENISKSLKIYIESNYSDFPFVAFSDNHDLSIYPKGHRDDVSKHQKCLMMSNVSFPYNSIKTAFEEAQLRISIENVELMRKTNASSFYINTISSGNKTFHLSPYQNTIIGKFGSGKSLLLERIKKGEESIKTNTKYSAFYDTKGFSIYVNDMKCDSLEELKRSTNGNLKIYICEQIERYYYKNSLNKHDAIDLCSKMNIDFTPVNDLKIDFKKDEVIESYQKFVGSYNNPKSISNLNYDLAFHNGNYFTLKTSFEELDYDMKKVLYDSLSNAKNVENISLGSNICAFSENEKKIIQAYINLLNIRYHQISALETSKFENKIEGKLVEYFNAYIKNESHVSLTAFRDDLSSYLSSIKDLATKCNEFQNKFNPDVFNELCKNNIIKIDEDYSIMGTRNLVADDYESAIESIFKSDCRIPNSIFQSTLETLIKYGDGNSYSYKNTFSQSLNKYVEKVNSNLKADRVSYDILKNNISMLNKSAGEKSAMFINLLFSLIEKDAKNEMSVIIVLDQPEDNIDNNNIYNQISLELRKLKVKYSVIQSIIVTHNANICIAADSENIILAEEKAEKDNKKSFNYKTGCIENPDFIKIVCDNLEGGKKAMEQRSCKYGINILKKVGNTDEI